MAFRRESISKKDDSDTNIDFSCTNGSVVSKEFGVGTITTGYHTYGFKVTGTTLCEFWLDGVKKGQLTTNIPSAEVAVSFAIQNGEAVAENDELGLHLPLRFHDRGIMASRSNYPDITLGTQLPRLKGKKMPKQKYRKGSMGSKMKKMPKVRPVSIKKKKKKRG